MQERKRQRYHAVVLPSNERNGHERDLFENTVDVSEVEDVKCVLGYTNK